MNMYCPLLFDINLKGYDGYNDIYGLSGFVIAELECTSKCKLEKGYSRKS
jgi:hypothetical protein